MLGVSRGAQAAKASGLRLSGLVTAAQTVTRDQTQALTAPVAAAAAVTHTRQIDGCQTYLHRADHYGKENCGCQV